MEPFFPQGITFLAQERGIQSFSYRKRAFHKAVLQFCHSMACQPPFRAGVGVFMRVRRPNFLVLFCISLYFLAAVYSAGATQKHAHKQATPETTVEIVPPPPPPPPLRPEQMPAVAPQVTFQNGKLTIIARNSTLGDILRAVHSKTGANVELSGSATERVVGMFGPGPSRDVVASLLNGSHFNYVMLGSEANPDQLQHLILTPKGGDGGAAAPPPQPVEAQSQPDAQPDAQDANGQDDFADADADQDANADQPAEDPNANGQQIGQPNAKTPEQMLLELQRQQQIQQQQQQQGGASTPGQGLPPGAPGAPGVPPQPQPPQ